jgi:thiamine transporter
VKKERPLLIMSEIAIMAALAFVLDLMTLLRFWPQGGNVSLAMVPLLLIAFRRGWKVGVATGFVFGLLNMTVNPYIVNWLQGILDYPVAFAVVGFAGIFKINVKVSLKNQVVMIIAGTVFGIGLRLLCHFTAGVVWFREFAPEGTPVALYSLTYNASYLAFSFIVCLIVLLLLHRGSKRLFHP